MYNKINAPRGADYQTRLVFPPETTLVAYTAALTVYSGPGGSALLTVTPVGTPNGSVLTLSSIGFDVLIAAADIAALPAATDHTQPSALAFEAVVIADGVTAKVAGGPFQVDPVGYAGATDYEQTTIDSNALAGIAA